MEIEQLKKSAKGILHGKVYFPTTRNGSFYRTFAVHASTRQPPNAKFNTVSGGDKTAPMIHFDERLSNQKDCLASVLSSVQAFLKSLYGVTRDSFENELEYQRHLREYGIAGRGLYVFLEEDVHTDIGGASEGLATLLALMGYVVPASVCVTGFVQEINQIGNFGPEELKHTKIQSVDCVPEKIAGCRKCNISIGYPEVDKTDEPEMNTRSCSQAVPLCTVTDAVNFVCQNGAVTSF